MMCGKGIIGISALVVVGFFLTLPVRADEPGLLERIDTNSKKAMEAINAGAAGEKIEYDPALESQYNGKAFTSGRGFTESGKSGETDKFLYEEKVSAKGYQTTRSFFGIKNPWIGRVVPDLKAAPLMARGILPGDKTYSTDSTGDVATRALPDGEREAYPSKGDVPTRKYLGKGKTQGAVTQFGGQLNKEMTIEEVREILNKNR